MQNCTHTVEIQKSSPSDKTCKKLGTASCKNAPRSSKSPKDPGVGEWENSGQVMKSVNKQIKEELQSAAGYE
jgi:hypothetical protein